MVKARLLTQVTDKRMLLLIRIEVRVLAWLNPEDFAVEISWSPFLLLKLEAHWTVLRMHSLIRFSVSFAGTRLFVAAASTPKYLNTCPILAEGLSQGRNAYLLK